MKPFLEGKTVLVAGGARGAGKAVARALHREGARVILCDRSPRDLIAAAKEIGEIICYPARLPGDAGKILRRIDRLDVLVTAGRKKTAAAVARAARAHLRRTRGRVVAVGGGKAPERAAGDVVRTLRAAAV